MICPNCKEKLQKIDNSYKCKNNHSFDISKQGYVNLLLNSKNSGDNKEMINSRHNFLNKGYFEKLLNEIISLLKTLNINNILDIGCGEGYYDRGIKKSINIDITGLDISKEACLKASKLSKDITYVVGSSNELPFEDNEFDIILNIFAPHEEKEFSRVCNKYILKVVPNKNHLIELKELLYENVIIKDEKKLDFYGFNEIAEKNVTYKVIVDDLFELFQMTPYYYKTKYDMSIFESNKHKEITCDFTVLLYGKKS
jgi:23S rRNA (guanine745-N1)-methyltransferase